jgi:hypothetical protein
LRENCCFALTYSFRRELKSGIGCVLLFRLRNETQTSLFMDGLVVKPPKENQMLSQWSEEGKNQIKSIHQAALKRSLRSVRRLLRAHFFLLWYTRELKSLFAWLNPLPHDSCAIFFFKPTPRTRNCLCLRERWILKGRTKRVNALKAKRKLFKSLCVFCNRYIDRVLYSIIEAVQSSERKMRSWEIIFLRHLIKNSIFTLHRLI